MMHRPIRAALILLAILLSGCASFPKVTPDARFADGLDAVAIFAACMEAHGGNLLEYPGDINLSTDGQWYALIQRIQPIVGGST